MLEQLLRGTAHGTTHHGVESATHDAPHHGNSFRKVDEAALAGPGQQANTDALVDFHERPAGNLIDSALGEPELREAPPRYT